ncbi:hypothetical protein CYMTET_23647, partial [Cymbomonas tetramitiformis]
VEAMLAVTTVICGSLFLVLGRLQLGNIIRFLPSPVIGGFLAGSGWVLGCGAFQVLTGVKLDPATLLDVLQDPVRSAALGPGVVFGAAMTALSRWNKQWYTIPTTLLGGTAIYFAALSTQGVSPQGAMDLGLLLGPFPEGGRFSPMLLETAKLDQVLWRAVWDQLPRMITVAGLGTIAILLNNTALEVQLENDIDVNQELQAAGLSNILAGLGGGLIGYHSLGSTTLGYRMGAGTRFTGFVISACYVLALWAGPGSLEFLPKALVGGLLVFLSLSFLSEWLVEGFFNMSRSDYGVVLTILATVAGLGYMPGVVVGILAAIVVFVSDYSKVPVVRQTFECGKLCSTVQRSAGERAELLARGPSTKAIVLQGFLFFGTAYGLLDLVKGNLADAGAKSQQKYLLMDFRYVVGIDGSALSIFKKISAMARANNIMLILTDIGKPELEPVLTELRGESSRNVGEDEDYCVREFEDLDRGLQWMEDTILSRYSNRAGLDNAESLSFKSIMSSVCKSEDDEAQFRKAWRYVQFQAGDVVCRKGDFADRIYFVETAELSASISAPLDEEDTSSGSNDKQPSNTQLNLPIMNNFLGAVGFYSNFGTVRFADVVVMKTGSGYVLTKEAVDLMAEANPDLAIRTHMVLAGHLSETIIARNKLLTQYYQT